MPVLPWRNDADGFAFGNDWTLDATERAALTALAQPLIPVVVATVTATVMAIPVVGPVVGPILRGRNLASGQRIYRLRALSHVWPVRWHVIFRS